MKNNVTPIEDSTCKDNWELYINEALRISKIPNASDGMSYYSKF
tara:strand:- start:1477 stop:1608 length:132 start_codon:yes stop_codon:yes gene_type:complete